MPRLVILTAVMAAPLLTQPAPLPPPNYCFGFLNAVPNRPELSSEEAMRIQKLHMAHLNALGEKRWLLGAGPILTPGGARGILISRCRSVAEANELSSADPAVLNGRLFVETYQWSGPEGIGDRYWKEKTGNPQFRDRMLKHVLVLLRKSQTGTGWPSADVMAAHSAHLAALRRAGKLLAAGPFHDSGNWFGALVFDGVTLEEARSIAGGDPMVRGGHARVEAFEWMAADGVFPATSPPAGNPR